MNKTLVFVTAILMVALSNSTGLATCPTPLTDCNLWDHKTGTIDPFCCTETVGSCQDYSVETWQCVAGGTRYRNLTASGSAMLGGNCGPLEGTSYQACY